MGKSININIYLYKYNASRGQSKDVGREQTTKIKFELVATVVPSAI